jgi:hypothetical protein
MNCYTREVLPCTWWILIWRRTNRAVLLEEPQMFHGMSELDISMLQGRANTAVRLVLSDGKMTQIQNSFAF